MQNAAIRDPGKYSSKLDQATRDAFDYYKAGGFWIDAVRVMREAADRNPSKFDSELNQVLQDALDYHKAKGHWTCVLDVMREVQAPHLLRLI